MGFDDYLEFTRLWLDNRCAWTKPTGRIRVNVSIDKNKNGKMPLSAHLTLAALQSGWKRHTTILWNEGDISRRAAWGSWKSASAPRVIAPADFDIVRCDPRRPAVSSAKVSLRERCKQADLEGMILRQVYRSAESCLIALSGSESRVVQSKIESGDVAGLTRCVLADSPDYDALLAGRRKRSRCRKR